MSLRKPSCSGGKVGPQVGEFRGGGPVPTSPDRVMPLESKLKVHPSVDLEKKPRPLQRQKPSYGDEKAEPQVRELRDDALVPTSPDCVTPPGSKLKVHLPVDLAKKPSPLQPQKPPRGGEKVGPQGREFRGGGPVPTSPDCVMPLETRLKVHPPVDLEKKPSPLQCQKPLCGGGKVWPKVWEFRDGALVPTSPYRVTLLEGKPKVLPPMDLEGNPSPRQCQKASCGGSKVGPLVSMLSDGSLVPTSPDRVALLESKLKVHPPVELEKKPSPFQWQKPSCAGGKVGPQVWELRDGALVPTSPDRVTLLESKLKVHPPV